jgi:hypothetical protein
MLRELEEKGVPAPDGTPLGNLRHTLAVYDDCHDDSRVIAATTGIYDNPTGLTWGDLRSILELLENAQ